MLILHAALVNGAVAVWGEVPFEAGGAPRAKKCAASAEQLRKALSDGGIASFGEAQTLIGWLPTAAGRPAPSSPLIGEPVPLAATRIEPWSIEVIASDDATNLLAPVVGKRLIAPGVIVG